MEDFFGTELKYMKEFNKINEFKRIAFLINGALFLTHSALAITFLMLNVSFMFHFNLLSITFYFVCFFMLRARHIRFFMYSTVVEILVHMIFATICCGWNYGFELYGFALSSVIFYTHYVFPDAKDMHILPLVVIALSVSIFIGLRLYTYAFPPIYPNLAQLPENIEKTIYIANATLSFLFIMFALWGYTKNVTSTEKKLIRLAESDELTQLYNRTKMDKINQEIEDKCRTEKKFCSISMMDIDNFKQINDTYGHNAGDKILEQIARVIEENCRPLKDCYYSRWGGEEFLVVQEFSHLKEDEPRLAKLMCRIRKQVAETSFCYGKQTIKVTITAGIANHSKSKKIKATIHEADHQLYVGKDMGKNCVVFKGKKQKL